ncbi:PQQ-dependent sugar dehydrogenase [Glutamicibacter endophyticus]|uniref:PQQ-dependent sugar dehydrogenase n=1 Tax=Glutamicibacter endophyticus TaxID=1522174 RepID=UPI003AF0F19D
MRHGPRATRIVPLVGLLLLLGACQTPPEAQRESPTPEPTVEVVAEGLQAPWSLASYRDALLVSERDTGKISELLADGSTRVLGTVPDLEPAGEGGLLGLAVQRDSLFAYYTTAKDNRVLRFGLEGDPGELALGRSTVILSGIPAGRIHNGGRMAIGPDDLLYVSTGDAGDPANAQDLKSLGGKILRVDADGQVPEDNPWPDSPVYSLGHRNVQGFDWADDGTLYASEFGQNTWDELNEIRPAGNYGWPRIEGFGADADFRDPLQVFAPAEASPSGLCVGKDAIYLAALRGERLYRIPLADPEQSQTLLTEQYGRLREVQCAADGSLLILTNNTDGRGTPSDTDDRLLRFTPRPTPLP